MHFSSLPAAGSYREITLLDAQALKKLMRRWLAFVAKLRNPYRPEQHYMRGPGPKWRAKHGEIVAAIEQRRMSVNQRRLA